MSENTLNIIHLAKRQDRRISFMRQIVQYKIHAQIWPGIIADLPWTGISRAYKQVVKNAKDSKLPYCIIADDDFELTHAESWKLFLEDMPQDFDLYFGGNSGGVIDEDWNEQNVKRISNWSGTFLFAVHQRFYDIFLAADESKNIDRWFGINGLDSIEKSLGRKPVYKVRYPMVCGYIDGYSDNSNKVMECRKTYLTYQFLRK